MGLCYVLAIHHLWKGRWGVRQLYPVAHDVEDFPVPYGSRCISGRMRSLDILHLRKGVVRHAVEIATGSMFPTLTTFAPVWTLPTQPTSGPLPIICFIASK